MNSARNDLQLSELQLTLMRVLWTLGEATTAQVHEAMSADRTLAYTTIATLLRRLEARGLLSHRREGRQFVYAPAVSEGAVKRSMVSGLLDNLFRGDRAALVSHLVGEDAASSGELDAIRDALGSSRDEETTRDD
jgi:predicted transcriptional regulator